VIVVLGAGAERIRHETHRPAIFVTNQAYQRGMTSSLQCGLGAVPTSADGVLFTLVDHPAVLPSTLDALLASPRPLVRVPRFGGKRGHPIWFSRELIAEFLAIPDGGAANAVVRRHTSETDFLDLDDPGIVADIDDPETYRNLIGARA
jgi:molybdenum cofactor cytidylyltransferase